MGYIQSGVYLKVGYIQSGVYLKVGYIQSGVYLKVGYINKGHEKFVDWCNFGENMTIIGLHEDFCSKNGSTFLWAIPTGRAFQSISVALKFEQDDEKSFASFTAKQMKIYS